MSHVPAVFKEPFILCVLGLVILAFIWGQVKEWRKSRMMDKIVAILRTKNEPFTRGRDIRQEMRKDGCHISIRRFDEITGEMLRNEQISVLYGKNDQTGSPTRSYGLVPPKSARIVT